MIRPPNAFLRSLSVGDFELLRPHLREVKLERSKMLFSAGDTIGRLYFPHDAVISVVVLLSSGDMIEAGMTGSDSVIGVAAALGDAVAINRAVVQISGVASTVCSTAAQAAVTASRSLRKALYQHDQMLLAQAQQSAACNAKHPIDERLCRWLLRTRDLIAGDTLELTQEFLAQMLGVRRTSVTLTAQHLQSRKLIKYRRGRITVVDREQIGQLACECYEAVKLHNARLSAAA
jgi:CRP-like cAMP-binding protein